jgi:hypothetical protein
LFEKLKNFNVYWLSQADRHCIRHKGNSPERVGFKVKIQLVNALKPTLRVESYHEFSRFFWGGHDPRLDEPCPFSVALVENPFSMRKRSCDQDYNLHRFLDEPSTRGEILNSLKRRKHFRSGLKGHNPDQTRDRNTIFVLHKTKMQYKA